MDDDQLECEIDTITAQIATKSPVGLARMKMLANDGMQVPPEVGLTMELEQSALHETSADRHEGIAAFNGKRTPKYIGR